MTKSTTTEDSSHFRRQLMIEYLFLTLHCMFMSGVKNTANDVELATSITDARVLDSLVDLGFSWGISETIICRCDE